MSENGATGAGVASRSSTVSLPPTSVGASTEASADETSRIIAAGPAALDQEAAFFVFHAGVQYGPATLDALCAWYIDGSLDRSSLVWDSAQSHWVPLVEFAPFRDHAAASAARDSDGRVRGGRPGPPAGATPVTGTAVYPTGYREGKERRRALRLPASLRLDFHVLNPRTRQPSSLLYSYALEDISIGGFGFSIYGTDIQAGSWVRAWIELEEENAIVALGEVVRVYGRRSIGVGFREISDRYRLEEFLSRRRP